MKKIIYSLLALVLMLSASSQEAQANSNFKLHGLVVVGGQFGERNATYSEENGEELYPFVLAQRVQFIMTWAANEKTTFGMAIRVPGEMVWGHNSGQKAFEGEEYVATKIANIVWKPSDMLTVTLGRYFYRGPDHVGFIGNPIQQDFTDGIRLQGKVGTSWAYDIAWGRNCIYSLDTDSVYFTGYDDFHGTMVWNNAGFGYPTKTNGYNNTNTASITYSDRPYNFDWFVYSATYKGENFQFQPYGATTLLGKDAVICANFPWNTNFPNLTGEMTVIYWHGFTSKVIVDDIQFGIDAVWNNNYVDYHDGGYLIDFYARKTLQNFRLGFISWYANGNKEDQIAGLQTVCFDGILGHTNSRYLGWGIMPFASGSGVGIPTGTTGAGLEFTNFKPFDHMNLTMNANLTYIHGTNHPNFTDSHYDSDEPFNLSRGWSKYLTTKDHVIDMGMSFMYFPERNIMFGVDMNYLMPHFGREGATQTKNGYYLGLTTQFNM